MNAKHTGGTRDRAREGGFSLLELLITCAILPMVLTAAYLVFMTMSGNYSSVAAQSEATSEAQRAMDVMVREMRQAQETTSTGGALAVAEANACCFYADMDRDGLPERITYRVAGTDLFRVMTEPSGTSYPYTYDDGPELRVVNLTTTSGVVFTYFYNDDPDTPASDPVDASKVSAIGIRLSASRPSQNGQIAVEFTTRVKIRALYNSLS